MHLTTKNLIRCITTAFAASIIIASQPQKARAATLYNGWNYAIDSFNDGVTGGQVGGGAFEFYGMAFQETAEKIFVALNTNLSLAGFEHGGAQGGSISYGDLFLNFSGLKFNEASTIGNLFAVRFAEGNDSGAETTGVYSNVIAKSVAETNSGYANLNEYNAHIKSRGGRPSTGDLSATDSYFEQTGDWTVLNVIDSGEKVGDISFLTTAALNVMGLDFAHFKATGSKTIGFSFDKSLMPSGSFIANFFAECANDGIAINGELENDDIPIDGKLEAVPEPSSFLGTLVALGLIGARVLAKRKHHRKSLRILTVTDE